MADPTEVIAEALLKVNGPADVLPFFKKGRLRGCWVNGRKFTFDLKNPDTARLIALTRLPEHLHG